MDDVNAGSLSDAEINEAVELLKKLKPGFIPFPLFAQIARFTALPIVEIMPLRKINNQVQILLTKRRESDEFWPGLWHVPGTVVRADDETLSEPFNRILKHELQNIDASKPQLVQSVLRKSERGSESAQIFWVYVTGKPKVGKFFNVDSLPDDIIKSQVQYIKTTIDSVGL